MTNTKATEILNDLLGECPQFSPDDRRDAVKLGIEALKRLEELRVTGVDFVGKFLPGETKD